jgi:hypothetical protein
MWGSGGAALVGWWRMRRLSGHMLQCVMVTLVIRPAMQGLHTGNNACRSSARAVWIVWGLLEAGYSSTPGYALVSDFPVHVFATQFVTESWKCWKGVNPFCHCGTLCDESGQRACQICFRRSGLSCVLSVLLSRSRVSFYGRERHVGAMIHCQCAGDFGSKSFVSTGGGC